MVGLRGRHSDAGEAAVSAVRNQDRHSPCFVPARDNTIEDLGGGIRRQLLGFGPDLMTCKVWFETGATGQLHAHPHSQTTYVESGRFFVVIDGEECELEPGDSFYVAPNKLHNATCREAGVLIDSFSPAREDFLGEEDRP